VSHLLPYLVGLACPLGMVGMMFMMRGGGSARQGPSPTIQDQRLADLEEELARLRQEHQSTGTRG
jgi:hypothetical protein